MHEKSERVGVSHNEPTAALAAYLQKAQGQGREINYLPTYRPEHQIKLMNLLGQVPAEQKASFKFMEAVTNQRIYKSQEELDEIHKACNVTADMHMTAMKVLRPGMKEYEVVAAMNEVVARNNYELSFATIATIDGQTLHNHYHGNTVKAGDLFLIDAGAETEMGYAGDMSSTIPVSKKFTTRQKEVYDIQNRMHVESVKALRPGIRFDEVYELSARVMVDGLKDLGLMKGDTYDAVKAGAHAMFYPHGLGHMMGLDVHDMENFGEELVGYAGEKKSTQFGRKSLRLARELEPGFVLTIEPGIYFIPNLIDLWKAEKKFTDFINYDLLETYKDFGGIRNEEDYAITKDGSMRMGMKHVPLTTDEVEALR